MTKLRILDLFSGIGGFSLGLERTGGFETVAFCEIEPFPRRVLAKHWPGVPCYEDVRTLTAARLAADGITGIDVITGGFPCQDLSVAGKQRGMGEGTRSGLWSEIVRLVGELRPSFVIVENVAALLAGPSDRRGGWFGRVLGDLAECGYDAEWRNIPAFMVGAHHRRERIWIVAHAQQERPDTGTQVGGSEKAAFDQEWDGQERKVQSWPTWNDAPLADATQLHGNGRDNHAGIGMGIWPLSKLENDGWSVFVADTYGARLQERQGQDPSGAREVGGAVTERGRSWLPEPDVGRVAHGVPDRAHRLAALGNAVVPQIPELIGHAILAAIREREAA